MSSQDPNKYSPPREEDTRVRGSKPLERTPLAVTVSVGVLALMAASTISRSVTITARTDPHWLERFGPTIAGEIVMLLFCFATWKRKRWGVVGLTVMALLNMALLKLAARTDVSFVGLAVFRAITLAPAFYYWNRFTWW